MGAARTPRSALARTQLRPRAPSRSPTKMPKSTASPPPRRFLTKTAFGGHQCHLVSLGVPPFHKLCRALQLTLGKGRGSHP